MIANRAAIEKLVTEMTADDKQMTPGPWCCNDPNLAIEGDLEHRDGPVLIAELGGEVMLEDGPAIVRARNNLPVVAAMLEGLLESAESDRLEIERLRREVYEAIVGLTRAEIANSSLVPGAMLTVSEIACLTVERDAARKEVERMRPVVEAAEWIRRGARGGGYAIATSLAYEDRRLFDKFNLAVDAYLYPDNLYRGEK